MEMMNPYFRQHLETRERLARYEIVDRHNVCNDFYILKFVKLDLEEVENNPIFVKAKQYLDSKEDYTENNLKMQELEEQIVQEMRDTLQFDI
jgi:hypothetical protein